MTILSELLEDDSIQDIARKTIKVGDVYRIKMNQQNGIVPKKGDWYG